MKFNWGHGIAIFFTCFVGFIAFLAFKASQVNIDLVAEDYYAREIAYQSHMDKMHNAMQLSEQVRVKQADGSLQILFPADAVPASGQITLFRPSDKKYDRNQTIKGASGDIQSLSLEGLPAGYYHLQLDWEADGTPYYTQQTIHIK